MTWKCVRFAILERQGGEVKSKHVVKSQNTSWTWLSKVIKVIKVIKVGKFSTMLHSAADGAVFSDLRWLPTDGNYSFPVARWRHCSSMSLVVDLACCMSDFVLLSFYWYLVIVNKQLSLNYRVAQKLHHEICCQTLARTLSNLNRNLKKITIGNKTKFLAKLI